MSKWDSLGTSKIQTPPKVETPHASWDEKLCKKILSTILISRDTAVCLQFGAKIQNNLGDLKRVSGENFFYILSLKVVFSGLKSIKGQKNEV